MNALSYFRFIEQSVTLPIRQKFLLPQALNFFVTSRCNARCEFCLYYEQINNPVAKDKELTIEEINLIAKNYGKLHYLGLSGGEPFVRKDIAQIAKAFVKHCDLKVLDIPSNFYFKQTMLDTVAEILSQNPSLMLELQLSVDNIGEKHDESRKVPGLFDKAIATFQALEKLRDSYPNLRLKINIVYLPQNRNSIDEICKTLSKHIRFDRIQLTFPHQLLNEQSPKVSVAEIEEYICKAEEIDLNYSFKNQNDLHTLGLRALKKSYHGLLKDAVTGKTNTGSYCDAGKQILVINEVGDVFPCEPLWDEKIGNLRESNYDINAILKAQKYKQFRNKYLGKDKCNCTFSCAINSEISTNLNYFPKLLTDAGMLYLNKESQNG